ncbi:MAG: GntR family transcriptional regulator [Azoarcus sp. PHD]|nr:MAG: GntR family transcriptional regulator [Azoarcus sp. PHD]
MNQISLSGLPLGAPLYQEVKRKIMESLRSGEWKPGEIIPSEKRLGERFGVSIGTVRKAVDELVAENILIRHQGRGTFVTSHTHDRYVFAFFHIIGQDGHKEYPKVELEAFASIKADADMAQRLGIRTGSKLFRLTNRLSIAGKPLIVDDIHVPERSFPHLTAETVRNRPGTLYQLYQDNFAVAVLRTEERLRACLADERLASLLEVEVGAPLLHIVRLALSFNDLAVELRHSYVNTAHHEYFAEEHQ